MRPELRCAVLFALLGCGARASACGVSASSMAFGPIDPLAHVDTDSSSSITVNCPDPTAYTVAINAGQSGSMQRSMSSGAQTLAYQLYTDASRATVWGDGTGGGVTVSGSADSTGTSHIVYGRVPSQPLAVPGFYIDTLLVTITF